MHISRALLLVGTMSCFSIAAAIPASCRPVWNIDWNQQLSALSNFQPFSNPGEIIPDVTINDTLQFVGLLWNAPSWQEIVGRVCVEYIPFLITLDPEDHIRRECDLIVTNLQKGEKSNVFGRCTSYWSQFDAENTAKQEISKYDGCLWYSLQYEMTSFKDLSVMCDFNPFVTVYSENLLERGSRIAFLLLEWLGPSPFSGDLYGACSALRILFSNRISDIINELKHIVTYPVADTLEYLKIVDVCSSTDHIMQNALNLLSIIDDDDICDFLHGNPSRDEYLQKGAALVDTILRVPEDEGLCTDVLIFVSSYDPEGVIGYQITGKDFTLSSSRRQFCRDISSALSVNSMYVPTSYTFPDDEDIANWMIDTGQILPNFYFIDAVKVLGAFLRSDKLLDGGIVLCDVFETFLSEFLEPSVSSMCTAVRNRDTAAAERMCLTISLQSTDLHPSLRVPTLIYEVVTGMDMARKLFEPDLPAISRDYVCSVLNDYFNSENNLQSLVRFGLNIYLAELLPIIDNICKDYDSVYDFVKDRTRLSPVEFRRYVSVLTDLLLTHLGYSDQEQFCASIAAGIDDVSGRARHPLVRTIQKQALTFLTDENRCIESFQSIRRSLTVHITNFDFVESLTKYTGYRSIQSLCGNISTFFDPRLCQASSASTILTTTSGTESKFRSLIIVLAAWIAYLGFRM